MIKLTVTTVGGNEFVFDDSVNAGSGMSALTQLTAKQMIHAIDSDSDEFYIPFHAVAKAVCEKDGQVVPITDDLCGGGASKPYCESYTYVLTDGDEYTVFNVNPDTEIDSSSIDGEITLRLRDYDGNAIDSYSVSSSNPSVLAVTDDGISDEHHWVTLTAGSEGEAVITFDIPDSDCLVAFRYYV